MRTQPAVDIIAYTVSQARPHMTMTSRMLKLIGDDRWKTPLKYYNAVRINVCLLNINIVVKMETMNVHSAICSIWTILAGCQKQVARAGTSNYIPQILWDVMTCPCPWYLRLAHKSSTSLLQVPNRVCHLTADEMVWYPHTLLTSLLLNERYSSLRCNLRVPDLQMSCSDTWKYMLQWLQQIKT